MKNLIFLCLLAFPVFSFSQNFSIDEELRLANHLLNTENNKEAVFQLQRTINKFSGSQNYADTLNYLLGYAYYKQKQLDESNEHLLKVSRNSSMYNQARFTSVYNSLYNNQYPEARDLLDNLTVKNELLVEYKAMQKAGLALLQKNYELYHDLSDEFSYKYFQLEKEQKELDEYYQELINFKPKSMAVAGLFSTVVPGTGKVYAGKLGEGLSAFLIVSILGAITTENYIKNGLNDYKTITFGSLFSIFYLGNIYGSMVSVKVYRDEFYKTYERKILVNIHIPLRNIFY